MFNCLLPLLLLPVALGAGESWTIPRAWNGKKPGTTEGNPIADNAGPRWRIDQIHPDRPDVLANWKPMQWAEVQKTLAWFNSAGSQGGHPQVRIEKGQCLIGCYSKAVNMDWTKVAAVAFIAPRAGGYRMLVESSSRRWEGDGAAEVRFFRLDRAAGMVEALETSICGDATPRRSESRAVRLAKGDELAASFWISGHHSGATVTASIGVATAKVAEAEGKAAP